MNALKQFYNRHKEAVYSGLFIAAFASATLVDTISEVRNAPRNDPKPYKPKDFLIEERDVNNDGRSDLIVRYPTNGRIYKVFLQKPDSNYIESTDFTSRLRAYEDSLEARARGE